MKNVLIAGGTGLIGSRLCELLEQKGYAVSLLSRSVNPKAKFSTYKWDIEKNEIDDDALIKADHIINLTGENIAGKRWSKNQKKNILESRTKSIQLINSRLSEIKHTVKSFVSASAVGYYGSGVTGKIYEEFHQPANDFLAKICQKWEQEVKSVTKNSIRTVILRTGIVLSKNGGALPKIVQPIKLGLGTAVGSGQQIMPWIHMDDLCYMYIHAIENENMIGAYNAVAPDFQTNHSFTKILCKILKRPFWPFRVPSFILKLMLGEMSQLVLSGNKISAQKIQKTGFEFSFPNLENAFKNVFFG